MAFSGVFFLFYFFLLLLFFFMYLFILGGGIKGKMAHEKMLGLSLLKHARRFITVSLRLVLFRDNRDHDTKEITINCFNKFLVLQSVFSCFWVNAKIWCPWMTFTDNIKIMCMLQIIDKPFNFASDLAMIFWDYHLQDLTLKFWLTFLKILNMTFKWPRMTFQPSNIKYLVNLSHHVHFRYKW